MLALAVATVGGNCNVSGNGNAAGRDRWFDLADHVPVVGLGKYAIHCSIENICKLTGNKQQQDKQARLAGRALRRGFVSTARAAGVVGAAALAPAGAAAAVGCVAGAVLGPVAHATGDALVQQQHEAGGGVTWEEEPGRLDWNQWSEQAVPLYGLGRVAAHHVNGDVAERNAALKRTARGGLAAGFGAVGGYMTGAGFDKAAAAKLADEAAEEVARQVGRRATPGQIRLMQAEAQRHAEQRAHALARRAVEAGLGRGLSTASTYGALSSLPSV